MKKILFGLLVFVLISAGTGLLLLSKAKFGLPNVSDLVLQKPENNLSEKVSGVDVVEDLLDHGPASIKILNGTKIVGITSKFEAELLAKMKLGVITKENAVRRDYPRSFVVDVNGKRGLEAKAVAFLLDSPITTIMPDSEATTSADLLVVIGENYR